MVIAGDINNSAVSADHLLREARVIGASASVVDDKSVVVELILYHVGSEFFRQQRSNFALRRHDNILGRQDHQHRNGNGRQHLRSSASHIHDIVSRDGINYSKTAWVSSRPRLTPTHVHVTTVEPPPLGNEVVVVIEGWP